MNHDDELKWESWLRQELKQLPDLQAPETLFHRVMLEVHTRARQPWWRRSWHGWPPALQSAVLVLLLGLATGFSYFLGKALQELPYEVLHGLVYEWLGPFAQLSDLCVTLWNALLLVMKSGGQQIMLYGSLFILALCGACIGLGTAIAKGVMNRPVEENGRL